MKSNQIFILLLITIGCASSLSSEQLKASFLSIPKDHNFKQQMKAMVQLSLAQNADVSQIMELLEHLKGSLQEEQLRDDKQYAQEKLDLEQLLAKLQQRVIQINTRVEEIDRTISPIEKRIAEVDRKLKVLNISQQILRDKQENLDKLRQIDFDAYTIRSQRQAQMLKAIDYLIGKVEVLNTTGSTQGVNANSFAQIKQEIFAMIDSLPKNSPIRSFLALTSTFDQATVAKILVKLRQIQKSLSQSIQDELDQESKAVENYKLLSFEIRQSQAIFNQQEQALKEERAQLVAKISALLQEKQDLQNELILVNQKIVQTQENIQNLTINYNKRKELRTANIDYVQKAQDTLADSASQQKQANSAGSLNLIQKKAKA